MSVKPSAHWRLLIVMCLCILLNASQRLSASDDTVVGKKLIRIATELRYLVQPSMADIDLVGKVASWQQSGYDGMVFSVASHSNPENPVSVNGTWWSPTTVRTYEDFVPEIEAFQAVDWGRLTDNLMWSGTAVWDGADTSQDWFNDDHWGVLTNSFGIQARVAKEMGFKGIMLDTEHYDHHALNPKSPWYYPFSYEYYEEEGYLAIGESSPRPYSEVVDKVYDRGQQYAQAISGAFPGLTLMVIPDHIYDKDPADPPNHDQRLFFPFMDGILAGLDDAAKVVAGMEGTYNVTDPAVLETKRDDVISGHLDRLETADEIVLEKLGVAVGIRSDGASAPGGFIDFSDTDVTQNYRTPEEHQAILASALALSGRYAWHYGQDAVSNYLETPPTALMQEYWQANEDAHLIGPVADTYIERTANPDVANATGNNLLLHNTSGSTLYEAWLKFDLSDLDPEDTQVIEAMLVLYLKSNSDVGETGFELLGVTDDTWGESTPGGDVPDLDSLIAWVGFDSSDVGVYTRIEIDVTEYVQASVGEGLDYLVSFALVPDAEDSPMISAIIASHRTTGDLSDYISGLSVSVTVPEPMTLGFLAVAGLVAMLRRRCKCDEL